MTRPAPIPFDTHRFVKRLTEEGMPAGQAEALADEQISLLNSHLATKQDISHLATKEDLGATNEAVAGCATKEAVAGCATKEAVAATNEAVARCATKEDFAVLERRLDSVAQDVAVLTQDVAVLKSDVRTLKWVVAGVGFGMLTVMVGVSSLVIQMFWTV